MINHASNIPLIPFLFSTIPLAFSSLLSHVRLGAFFLCRSSLLRKSIVKAQLTNGTHLLFPFSDSVVSPWRSSSGTVDIYPRTRETNYFRASHFRTSVCRVTWYHLYLVDITFLTNVKTLHVTSRTDKRFGTVVCEILNPGILFQA